MWKNILGQRQTVKTRIILSICTGFSMPFQSIYRITVYGRIYQCAAKALVRLHSFTDWSVLLLIAYTQIHVSCHVHRTKTICLPNHTVWSVFVVSMKKLCILGYPVKILFRLHESESSVGTHVQRYLFWFHMMLPKQISLWKHAYSNILRWKRNTQMFWSNNVWLDDLKTICFTLLAFSGYSRSDPMKITQVDTRNITNFTLTHEITFFHTEWGTWLVISLNYFLSHPSG